MTPHRHDLADDVRRALDALSPMELARRLGRKTRKEGRRAVILCPAHDERTPSCTVEDRAGRLVWHCFGCGAGGDALALVAAVSRLDVRRDFRAVLVEAALVAGDAGLAHRIDSAAAREPRRVVPGREARMADDDDTPNMSVEEHDAAVRPCIAPLVETAHDRPIAASADVASYLAGRRILDGAIADGWGALDLNEIRYRVEERIARGGDLADEPLVRAGLARVTSDGWIVPYAAHVVCIPWRDPDGRIVALQRRAIANMKPKYVFGAGHSPRWPYGVERLADAPADAPVTLVEGAIDTLAARELYRRADAPGHVVLGVPGVSAWHDEWTDLLAGRHVRIAFDADDAGNRAVMRVARAIANSAKSMVRIEPRNGHHDWAEQLAAQSAIERTA